MMSLSFTLFLCIAEFCRAERLEVAPLTTTTKTIAWMRDSSCVILLHSQTQIREDHQHIFNILRILASDLDLGVEVSTISFGLFSDIARRGGQEILCNNPMVLIIHSDDQTRRDLVRLTHRIRVQNLIWLVYTSMVLEEYFQYVNTPFDMDNYVGLIHNSSCVEFFEVYRAARKTALRTNRLGSWTEGRGFDFKNEIMFNRRRDLEGIVFRTGSTQNSPVHSFEPSPTTGELELVGYFPAVWRQLETFLNFTSINYPSVDKVTGIPEQGGSWSGLVGMLQRHEIDVAVSEFIMDEQRSHVVDFSRPLLKSTYQIFFRNVGNSFQWNAILRPFHQHVWLTVLGWIFVGSVFLCCCHWWCHEFRIENHTRERDFSLVNSILFITRSLCNQGHTAVPSAISCRIIYLSAYMAAGVLVPSYSAALISYLTSKTPKRPFDSLEGLLEDGTYTLQTNSKTAEYTYFSTATAPLLQNIFKKLMAHIPETELPLNTQEALDNVCKNPRLAHFGDMVVASSYLEVVNAEGRSCNIIHLSQGISTIYSCMAFTRYSPYRSVINHFLQKMEDSGLISQIKEETTPRPRGSRASWNAVENNDVGQIFIILLLGLGAAVAFCILERLAARLREDPESTHAKGNKSRPHHKNRIFVLGHR